MAEIPESLGMAGAAALLLKPVADVAAKLVERMLGKPCDLLGETARDQIAYFRWSNQIRIFGQAAKKLEDQGVHSQQVPPSFLFPLIESAGMIDDAMLQDLFANLIAKSNSEAAVRQPLFLDTLKRLSSEDASFLKLICHHTKLAGENFLHSESLTEVQVAAADRLKALALVEIHIKPQDAYGEDGELLSDADDLHGPVILDPAGEVLVVTRFGRQFLDSVGMPMNADDPDWYSAAGVVNIDAGNA